MTFSNFEDFLNESNKNSEQNLNEATMTRFLKKFKMYDAAIITAHRGNFSKKENRARNKDLFSALFASGYSVTSVKGSYIENLGHETQKEVLVSIVL